MHLFVGSAPVGSIPSQHPLQQQYQNHRNVHATLSNSSAPLMRGSSSSSISTSQDHLTQFHNSPNHSHSGYNHGTTAMNKLNNQHQPGTLPPGLVPPPPIKQRSLNHRRTNSGNNHDSSPSNHVITHTPSRPSGIHSGVSPPYANASAAEVDLLNNSFGSDRGAHGGGHISGSGSKQAKFHHVPPRHAPKQPPPPAPIGQGGTQLAQPPYIPPPQPRGSNSGDNNVRKMSNQQIGTSREDTFTHYIHHQQRGTETSELTDSQNQIAR